MQYIKFGKFKFVPRMMVFVEHLKVLYPQAERVERKIGPSFKTVYTRLF